MFQVTTNASDWTGRNVTANVLYFADGDICFNFQSETWRLQRQTVADVFDDAHKVENIEDLLGTPWVLWGDDYGDEPLTTLWDESTTAAAKKRAEKSKQRTITVIAPGYADREAEVTEDNDGSIIEVDQRITALVSAALKWICNHV